MVSNIWKCFQIFENMFKYLNIFQTAQMFEVFAYNVYEKLECSPSRTYFLSCYIYHDRRPTRGIDSIRVWIMGHTIAMKIHENTFILAVGVNDYY